MRNPPLVLVVDDESNFREIIGAKLKTAGYEVAFAKNSAEAIVKSEQLLPDLILMDIMMPPGATGTDTALAIKQNPKTKDVKIAFLTSLKEPWPAMGGDPEAITKELGIDNFFDKTDDLETLPQKVWEVLTGGAPAGSGNASGPVAPPPA